MYSRVQLGWNSFFEQQRPEGSAVARVVQVERDAWKLDGDVEGWTEIAGRYRHEVGETGSLPAVGDWVVVERGVITGRLERRSVISRAAAGRAVYEQVIAANIDTVFVVTSANDDLSERRLERYLSMIWDSGAVPVVVVNKSDLAEDPESIAAALRDRLPFVDVVLVSALNGVEQPFLTTKASAKVVRAAIALAPYLQPGKTVALVGSSGVGKSTIVNALMGADVQKVAAIRESDGTGRHTTTARQLIALPGGALLIDTPGMRELQLWDDAGIDSAFDDIAALAEDCRFGDCSHTAEPGCAVLAAVESGALDADRLDHYNRLQRELAHEERRRDKGAAAAQKKKLKTMMRAQKALYRNRER